MIYFQKSHFLLIFIDTGSQMLEIKSEVWKRFCLWFSANNFGERKYQTVMKATYFCFHWHYIPLWALACRIMSLHFVLSPTLSTFLHPQL